MSEFEARINELIDAAIKKRVEENSCEGCGILMLERTQLDGTPFTLWCPMCGRQRAAKS